MDKEQIKIGGTYYAEISRKIVAVTVVAIGDTAGFTVTNLATGRTANIGNARQFYATEEDARAAVEARKGKRGRPAAKAKVEAVPDLTGGADIATGEPESAADPVPDPAPDPVQDPEPASDPVPTTPFDMNAVQRGIRDFNRALRAGTTATDAAGGTIDA